MIQLNQPVGRVGLRSLMVMRQCLIAVKRTVVIILWFEAVQQRPRTIHPCTFAAQGDENDQTECRVDEHGHQRRE